ncbi:magnesium/cobalt transporter CorA [Tianweitania sediminis]|uniref:Magnesium transport protein CorA n=1 Tax=Tianweitania sediminis TaxID=1502156 RepID=A0A8J7RP12_9HYPH|nr:magnesium/cobalt transporter CorA [Tianweitania sediminis]MBP0439359.1 magnesium/cobalt transporter CorA [Tianweitania sediminis]
MLRAFAHESGLLARRTELDQSIIWVDLMEPSKEEEDAVEAWLGAFIPTREEMAEIETSSRLYVEDGSTFMTATLPSGTEGEHTVLSPVTFVLSKGRLVTIRYHEPRAFATFPMRAEQASLGCFSGETILTGLLEAIVDRLADILESVGRDIVKLSNQIFHAPETKASDRDRNFQQILRQIGRKEDLVSGMQDSLISLQRLVSFLTALKVGDKETKSRGKTLLRDIQSLSDYASALSGKVTFLLDATLGMINIEQNAIVKIVSVGTVVFLPPTLVGTVYGMNFQNMPELNWTYGYPLALIAMALSAILPFWFFRRRGWL